MLEEVLEKYCADMGFSLPEGACALFRRYYEALSSAPLNLTAVKGEEDTARLHFADSLALLAMAEFAGKTVIDVGTGGGFPGLPLKIAVPGCDVTLLDSTGKKIAFLRDLCGELAVSARCVCGRAEDLAFDSRHREAYDIVTSRAVARLNVLTELCLPLARPGGLFIAMKSVGSDDEVDEARPAVDKLGGRIREIRDYQLPGGVTHRAVLVEKISETPSGYPRKYAKIVKNPL